MEKLFTRKDAAAQLGVSVTTLDEARKAGSLSYIQFSPNGKVLFTDTALQEFVAKSTHQARPIVVSTTFRKPRKRVR